MNILFLDIYGGGFMPGGTEVYLKNLLKELNKIHSQRNFFVATFNKINNVYDPYVNRVEDSFFSRFLEDYKILKIQLSNSIFAAFSFILGIICLYKTARSIIKNNKIDLVYSNGGHLTAIVAYLLNKKYHQPYILHFHGTFGFSRQNFFSQGLTLRILKKACSIIANSKDCADDIEKINNFNRQCDIVKCFVDAKIFRPLDKNACRKQLKLNPDDFIVVSTNRFEHDKKVDLIAKTIFTLPYSKVKLILIGDGPLSNYLHQLAEKDKRIVCLPPMDNELLPVYLNAADIVWGSCSVYYLTLTIIEALACAVPIMASIIPSPLDAHLGNKVDPATLPDEIGFLLKENKKYLTRFFSHLIKNKRMLEKKKVSCLKFYQKEYGRSNIVNVMKIIYNS